MKKASAILALGLSLLAIFFGFQNFKSLDAPTEKQSEFNVEKEENSFDAIHRAVIESDISLQQKSKLAKKKYYIKESDKRSPSSEE